MAVKNIIPHKYKITKEDRNRLTGNRSLVIWLTGLSGSGKSTIANNLEQKLFKDGVLTYILDGDNVRNTLNKDLGFLENDRRENIRRIGEVSKIMTEAGLVVITAFISPFNKERQMVRDLLSKDEFIEVYIKCPLEICRERDVKGLYSKAQRGELKNFTGVDSPYEEPDYPDITIDTNLNTIDESTHKLYEFIKDKLRLQTL